MTRQDYFISKTNLIAQIESAKKFGCKHVLKCAKLNLAELKSGVKHSDVVKWAMIGLTKTIYHPENIVDARFIMD